MFTTKSSFMLKRNVDFSESELLEFAMSISPVEGGIKEKLLHWEFGPIMTMKHDVNASNYLFSDEAVPFHWDGAFFKEPKYLLFYCTESEGEGGETTFVDTTKLWNSLTPSEQDECLKVTLTYETAKLAHYGGKITLPVVQSHPVTGKKILRLAERVDTKLNPVTLKIDGVRDAEDFYQTMVKKLYENAFVHSWTKGDLLCVDNSTYLHGRQALGLNRKRTFKRIQIL